MEDFILGLYRESIYALYIEKEDVNSYQRKLIRQNAEELYPYLAEDQRQCLDRLISVFQDKALRMSLLGFLHGLRLGGAI